jgi:hypothetical protein
MPNYEKLRPWTDISYCDCKTITSLILVYTLTDNPIHCYQCKGALDPERLQLSDKEIDSLASWDSVFSALYNLWLDSGEYEDWAKAQLLDKSGQVNLQGMNSASLLSEKWPAYYWWFYDEEDPCPSTCPNCGSKLDNDNRHGHGKCSKCHVVI